MIEEGCEVSGLEIVLRLNGQKVSRVYTAPDCTELSFTEVDSGYKILLPSMKGYAVIVAE